MPQKRNRAAIGESLRKRGWPENPFLLTGTAVMFGDMSQSGQQVNAYRFRIVLRRTSPHIWRRVVVRSDSTLGQLHQAAEALFRWAD